jgi:hypothetical protein
MGGFSGPLQDFPHQCDCQPHADHTKQDHKAVNEILEEANRPVVEKREKRPSFPAMASGLAGIDRPFSLAERVPIHVVYKDGAELDAFTAFGDPENLLSDGDRAKAIQVDLEHAFIRLCVFRGTKDFPEDTMWILVSTDTIAEIKLGHGR